MYFLSNLPHYEFIYEDDFVKMPPNGLGYEQCGFYCTSFSNRYVVYFCSLFSILSLLPALLIAVVGGSVFCSIHF